MERRAHIELEDVDIVGVNTLARVQSLQQLMFNYRKVMENVRVPILRGITLTIREGERVGFVGRNGSGKTSLLRVVAGIYPPRRGRVSVQGRVAPLIEMGVGFDPDFTGRQNIKIGLLYSDRLAAWTPELEEQVIAFSELGDKIDLPLKAYSLGMRARLAFAVAVFQEPEILLLDEAFATGDAEFLEKSHALMKHKFSNVSIALLVSHDTQVLAELCTRCIWVENGSIHADGPPKDIIRDYLAEQHHAAA